MADTGWFRGQKIETVPESACKGMAIIDGRDFIPRVREASCVMPNEEAERIGIKMYKVVEGDTQRIAIPRGVFKYFGMLGLEQLVKVPAPSRYGNDIALRDYQQEPVRRILAVLRDTGGTILNADCGTGKTVLALEIAHRMKQSVCVLVHKEFLMDQWESRIKEFLPDAKIGRWQRDAVSSGREFDFVLAMVQSLTKREYADEQYQSFGMLICDEVHRHAAETWAEAIPRFGAAYRLGLTATPTRRDGMEQVFFKHIGDIGYSLKMQMRKPSIYFVDSEAKVTPSRYMMYNGEPNTAKLLTILSKIPSRTVKIIDLAVRAARKGRKVLILSGRLEHIALIIKEVNKLLETDGDGKRAAKFVGGMKAAQRDEASKAEVIVGTYAMAQEGLDIADLDTLILATPIVRIQQSIGRILRTAQGKQAPVVVDITDDKVPVMYGWRRGREKEYRRLNYI